MANFINILENYSSNKNWKTPFHKAKRISNLIGVDLRFKRDDLFPICGGGNKARMMSYKIHEIE